MVRRRRFQRTRRRREEGPSPSAVPQQQGTTTILGVVLAGDAYPLPYAWQQPGRQLLIRPYVSDLATSMHMWSGRKSGGGGGGGGRGSVLLDELDESTTWLLGCWPRGMCLFVFMCGCVHV